MQSVDDGYFRVLWRFSVNHGQATTPAFEFAKGSHPYCQTDRKQTTNVAYPTSLSGKPSSLESRSEGKQCDGAFVVSIKHLFVSYDMNLIEGYAANKHNLLWLSKWTGWPRLSANHRLHSRPNFPQNHTVLTHFFSAIVTLTKRLQKVENYWKLFRKSVNVQIHV